MFNEVNQNSLESAVDRDRRLHNEWVEDLINDVDFQSLKDFLEQLKENE